MIAIKCHHQSAKGLQKKLQCQVTVTEQEPLRERQNVAQEQHLLNHLWERPYLCDILSWKDCIANISCARGWCQHSARGEVGEVGLDLWQWSGWHDKSLLGLTSSDYLRS